LIFFEVGQLKHAQNDSECFAIFSGVNAEITRFERPNFPDLSFSRVERQRSVHKAKQINSVPAQRCLSATEKLILEDHSSSVLSIKKNITPLET